MLVTLWKIGEAYLRFLGTNGFHVKGKNENFTAEGSRCRQNLLTWESHVVVSTKKRAARWIFFIQPIKSLICVVAITLDIS